MYNGHKTALIVVIERVLSVSCDFTALNDSTVLLVECPTSKNLVTRCLSVWSEVQIVCIWSSWCHCIPKPGHLLPHSNPDWFHISEYRLTQVVQEKRPLNGCCVCDFIRQVALVDYGWEVAVGEKDVWVLPSSCAMTPGFALRCHLADIVPAGDITKWSQTACETLHDKLMMSPAVCFLAPKVLYCISRLNTCLLQ